MDIPSLFMIPSAVSSGKVHSVFPNSTDADFDFNRDSDATRVNSEGLIERVGYYGSEKITNGTFDADSNWGKSSGATISNGKANIVVTSGSFQYIDQGITYVAGKKYRLTATIQGTSGKALRFQDNASNTGGLQVSNGTVNFNGNIQAVDITWAANSNSNILIIARSGTGDFSFTVDNVSVVEVTGDRARLNYEIEGGLVNTKPSLLLENQSTNLVTYSKDFSHSSYIKVNSTTIVSNEIKAPDNTTTADLIKAAQTGSIQGVYNNISFTSGQSYAFSVFAKKKENIYLQVQAGGGTFGTCFANFDLENGVVGTVSGGTGQIEAFTNDWYRCIFIVSAISTGTGNISLDLTSSSTAGRNDNFTGNVGDGLYIWGAMVEQQSYATSYIPTNGSTQTRAAETCNGAVTSSIFESSEGILYTEISVNGLPSSGFLILGLNDGTVNNNVFIEIGTNGLLTFFVISGGTNVASKVSSVNPLNNFVKCAIRYKLNDVSFWINGTEIHSDTSATMPVGLSQLDFDYGNNSHKFYGNVRDIRVYNTKEMTDSEVDILLTKITS